MAGRSFASRLSSVATLLWSGPPTIGKREAAAQSFEQRPFSDSTACRALHAEAAEAAAMCCPWREEGRDVSWRPAPAAEAAAGPPPPVSERARRCADRGPPLLLAAAAPPPSSSDARWAAAASTVSAASRTADTSSAAAACGTDREGRLRRGAFAVLCSFRLSRSRTRTSVLSRTMNGSLRCISLSDTSLTISSGRRQWAER